MAKMRVHLLKLGTRAPYRMLQLEEALMRGDDRNWCITNRGTSPPHIVLGTGGRPRKLLDVAKCAADGVPLIKRFSGGGTVIVDENTLFVSFVGNSGELSSGAPRKESPKEVMEWSGGLFASVFDSLGVDDFALTEHDYVFRGEEGESSQRKCAGNAQAFSRSRWVHHTSFLWRFDPARMAYLALPEKRPEYRADRAHGDFLKSLADRGVDSPGAFYAALEDELRATYDVVDVDENDFDAIYAVADERNERENHGRRTTRWVDADGAKVDGPPRGQ
jgi:lipoate-protein ligase A